MSRSIILSGSTLFLAANLLAAPAVVKLSGTVTKTGAGAIKGATVTLKSASSLSATTGADGKFLISTGSSGIQSRSPSNASAVDFAIAGQSLVVKSNAGNRDGSIEVFGANAARVFSQRLGGQESATRSLPIAVFPHGMNIVRVRIGEEVCSRAVLRIDHKLILKDDRSYSTEPVMTPASKSAAATAVDSLVATKAGFKDKTIPVTSYLDSNLVISMDSIVAGTCTAPKAGTSKSNPIFTDVYTADPAVMVDNCTFYIQCGHDQGTGGFDLREWYLLKSTDMVNWTRTTPMSLKTFAWTNANAWAGQMIHARNGKYYWYVPINDIKYSADRMAIGVAVADSPEGPWKDALGKPLIYDSLEMSTWNITNIDQTPHTIDPTVFIDDDGQAYIQYGGFWTMVTAKLNPDMISINGKLTKTTPLDYFESPYLVKRNSIYYEIYAHGAANPTTIDYATSSSPMGPWTHKGTIIDTLPRVAGQDATTNHAGVGEFAGQWYIVYHVSNGPNGGGTYRREVAIDKLTFNADGTIQPVIPSAALTF